MRRLDVDRRLELSERKIRFGYATTEAELCSFLTTLFGHPCGAADLSGLRAAYDARLAVFRSFLADVMKK